jgi:hypothetical protein
VLGGIVILELSDLPQMEIDYNKSIIACEISGDLCYLRWHIYNKETNLLVESSDADAKGICINSYQTAEEYKASQIVPNGDGGFFSNLNSTFGNDLEERERLEAAGYGNYRLEIVDKLSQPWYSFLKGWGIAFSIALLILFALRQSTIYILAGRS